MKLIIYSIIPQNKINIYSQKKKNQNKKSKIKLFNTNKIYIYVNNKLMTKIFLINKIISQKQKQKKSNLKLNLKDNKIKN